MDDCPVCLGGVVVCGAEAVPNRTCEKDSIWALRCAEAGKEGLNQVQRASKPGTDVQLGWLLVQKGRAGGPSLHARMCAI